MHQRKPEAHSSTPQNLNIIEATVEHKHEISHFLDQNKPIHSHLDWLSPLEWLGEQPFLLEMNENQIQAVMLTAPEVKGTSWMRLFVTEKHVLFQKPWNRLLTKTASMLKELNITQLASLCFNEWFKSMLIKSSFYPHNAIVTLEWTKERSNKVIVSPHVAIRPMTTDDLSKIEKIDRLAFSSLWQYSLSGLTKAYQQSNNCTVAIQSEKIIGYQITSVDIFQGHLSRLAIHPDYQQRQIASALLLNLLKQLVREGVWRVTVNTQTDNKSSLALYEKFGFILIQNTIPVYLYQL